MPEPEAHELGLRARRRSFVLGMARAPRSRPSARTEPGRVTERRLQPR